MMTGHITVKRYDYPERTRRYRNGETHTIPAFFESYYFWNGKEIAYYNSRNDTLFLSTARLGRSREDYFERMKKAPKPEMWADLTEFLGITENTRLSEYFNL